jgi:hypothetical protein
MLNVLLKCIALIIDHLFNITNSCKLNIFDGFHPVIVHGLFITNSCKLNIFDGFHPVIVHGLFIQLQVIFIKRASELNG